MKMEAIRAFVSGNYVFVSLPTGYGKSLCYVLLPLVFDALLNMHVCVLCGFSQSNCHSLKTLPQA